MTLTRVTGSRHPRASDNNSSVTDRATFKASIWMCSRTCASWATVTQQSRSEPAGKVSSIIGRNGRMARSDYRPDAAVISSIALSPMMNLGYDSAKGITAGPPAIAKSWRGWAYAYYRCDWQGTASAPRACPRLSEARLKASVCGATHNRDRLTSICVRSVPMASETSDPWR
jgi:hypothetical protein